MSRSASVRNTLFLNAFAILGAAIGLANAALAWRLYGIGQNADLWMMSLAIIQSFVLLAQLGVEQAAIFSSEIREECETKGARFDRDSLTWALMFGFSFAALIWLVQAPVINIFAHGFSNRAQRDLNAVLSPLLLQVAVAPSLYVLRQQLLLRNRARLSILLNNTYGAIQCSILIVALQYGLTSPVYLGWAIGILSAAITLFAVFAAGESKVLRQWPDWALLLPFIRASVALRFTHSVHNFLVVLLTNSALSTGLPGTVALFQYVKKVADGLSGVSIGPHMSVYHAAQAQAWTSANRQNFDSNIRRYLISAIPMLVAATVLFLALAAIGINFVDDARVRVAGRETILLLVLLAWQLLIAIETIAAGVLVLEKRADQVLIVNAIYVINFYVIVQCLTSASHQGVGVAVALTSLGCQAVSLALFSALAIRIMGQKEWKAVNA